MTITKTHFGVHRLPIKTTATRTERIERAREMLARALNLRTIVAVVGSGYSVPLGYPTWKKFALQVVERTLLQLSQCPDKNLIDDRKQVSRFKKQLEEQPISSQLSSQHFMLIIGCCKRILYTLITEQNSPFYLEPISKPRTFSNR